MKLRLPVIYSILLSAKQKLKELGTNSSTSYTEEPTQSFETTTEVSAFTIAPSDSDENDYQYIFIGVYTFFVIIFVLGIIFLCGKRIRKACCDDKSENEATEPYEATGNVQDVCGASSNVPVVMHDDLLVNTVAVVYDDEEYDYYSMDPDQFEETRNLLRDKPPPYDEPPPYSPD